MTDQDLLQLAQQGPRKIEIISAVYGVGNRHKDVTAILRENVAGFPLITYHLLKRGYKEEDIKKILGGNFLRLFEEVIAASKSR